MRVHEALRLCLPLLQRLRDNGVRMEDIDYIPMYEEYLAMKDRGDKITYIMTTIADRHKVSERTLYRVFAALSRELK